MKKIMFLIISFFTCYQLNAQQLITFSVKDSITNEPIPFCVVFIAAVNIGEQTNVNGIATLKVPDREKYDVLISAVGYAKKNIQLLKSDLSKSIIINLSAINLEEVIITSTRTNARIEDLPIKVEVLGLEEMDEESSIVPGGIGSILGDLSVITVQKTNPTNGNDAIRMQGLPSKYTKIIKDGLPLYDGFSGSLGVLSIPPLDLQQVEIIKGCGSTLYGENAIGGVINFISKTPTDSFAGIIVGNHTSLNENNINFYAGQQIGKSGYTLFLGGNLKEATDVNNDKFTEVPQDENYIIHPRFFYQNKKLKLNAGYNLNYDNRKSGMLNAIKNGRNAIDFYSVDEKYIRNTIDFNGSYSINEFITLNYKSAVSNYNRNYDSPTFYFKATELSTYQELNTLLIKRKHTAVFGLSYIGNQFNHDLNDSATVLNKSTSTLGIFVQDDYKITDKIKINLGYRYDYANKNQLQLPSAGFFIKPNDAFSIRIRYATGYSVPTTLNELDITELNKVRDSLFTYEKSDGYNADINYSILIGNKLLMDINQAFYYTAINNPSVVHKNSNEVNYITNEKGQVRSVGTDTYIRLKLEDWELYLGYNHTLAYREGINQNYQLPFNPNDKFACTLAYEIEGKWRMGIEAAYNANQVNTSYDKVPDYWFTAVMIERKINHLSIVLNCENLNDFQQSKYGDLVKIENGLPIYSELWGPIEGRVINLSMKYKF